MIGKLFSLVCLGTATQAADKEAWKSRTIYQVITDRFARTDGSTQSCDNLHAYCGGTWKGLQDHLDYIQGMGFDAIWISPIPKNKGNDYHGYGALNWYEVNEHMGTEQDLQNLIDAAHQKGIYMMLDVVANHVAPVDTDFSQVTPFNKSEYFHSKCQISNWNDPGNVEYCRLANLPDLNQDNSFVRETLKNWVHDTVAKFGFDGIRVDTVPEVKKEFWTEYREAAGVYQVGEVFNGDIGYVSQYQGPLDATLNYPMYFTIKSVWDYKQSMYSIRTNKHYEQQFFKDVSVLGTFIDNHDNVRFLNANDNVELLKGALTFQLFNEGIPIVYYGTEQAFNGGNDPYNRAPLWTTDFNTEAEVYQFLKTAVGVRKQFKVWEQPQVERWVLDDLYAFSRGDVFIATTNQVDNEVHVMVTYHPYKAGDQICNVLYTGDCVTITDKNELKLDLLHGESKIFVPKAQAEAFELIQE